jgi:hypothetical protein
LGKKPIRWDYYDEPDRKALHDVFVKMIEYHTNKPVFSTADYTIDLTENFKTVVLRSPEESAVAMANFDVVPVTKTVNFGKTGTWLDSFYRGIIELADVTTKEITLQPGEYHLYFLK